MIDITSKSTFNWNFKEDDWLVELVFIKKIGKNISNEKLFGFQDEIEIIYEIYNLVKD